MQSFTSCTLLLVIMLVTYIPSPPAQAIPVVDTTSLAKLNNTSGTVPMGIRLPLNPPKNESATESCEQDRQALRAFICSTINNSDNSTVIHSNTDNVDAILKTLACDNAAIEIEQAENSKPDYDQWITSVATCVSKGMTVFILLDASIKMDPSLKTRILATSALTTVATAPAVIASDLALSYSRNPLMAKWIELINGLTGLLAGIHIAGWAVAIASGKAGKQKLLMSSLLMNVISFSLRETATGTLSIMPIMHDQGKHYAGTLALILPLPIVLKGIGLGGKEYGTPGTVSRFLLWAVAATLGMGLITDAWHQFEEVAGRSYILWNFDKNIDGYDILSHNKLPMSLAAPFGYRSDPTAITVTAGVTSLAVIALTSFYYFMRKVNHASLNIEASIPLTSR